MSVSLPHLAVVTGMLAGGGVALLVASLVPGPPHLGTALTRLAPHRHTSLHATTRTALADRLGTWVEAHVGTRIKVPATDLAVLRIQPTTWVGQKILLGLVGLALPAVAGALLTVLGTGLSLTIPAATSLLLALLLFFLPDLSVRRRAGVARREFVRDLNAYMELAALARAAGAGVRLAMETAANLGGAQPFHRLREELLRSRLTNNPPWQGLTDLSTELDIPELAELAHMLRQAVEQNAPIYDMLRSRARNIRHQLLTDEQARAGAITEQMVIPSAVATIVFLILLAAPAAIRFLEAT